jgi:hypothetical protein
MYNYNYIMNAVLFPQFTNIMVYVVAALITLSYLITTTWILSMFISLIFSTSRSAAEWIVYPLIVIFTPCMLLNLFHYEVTMFTIAVFVFYSVLWLLKKAYFIAYHKQW